MTAPTPDGGTSTSSGDRPRFRAGQVVTFRTVVADLEVAGHALVLKVLGELLHLAVLGGGGHVQATADEVTPASVSDVPNPLPTPEEPADGSGS